MTKSLYCCPRCGSFDIQAPHWVALNTEEILGEYTSRENWCPACEEHFSTLCLIDLETGTCAFCQEVHSFEAVDVEDPSCCS